VLRPGPIYRDSVSEMTMKASWTGEGLIEYKSKSKNASTEFEESLLAHSVVWTASPGGRSGRGAGVTSRASAGGCRIVVKSNYCRKTFQERMETSEDGNLGGEIAHTRFGTRCRCGVPERIRGRAGVIGGTPVLRRNASSI
jgi:hypothetical protein